MNALTNQLLTANIQGQLQHNTGRIEIIPLCISGKPGLGKTASIYSIGESLDLPVVYYSMPSVTIEAFSGLPNFENATSLKTYHESISETCQATVWSAPELIAQANLAAEQHGGAILFLDDLHRITPSAAPYMYSLLGERKLGQFNLHPKVAIIAAMNDSETAGFEGMDSPIKDRLSILPVQFDFEYWFDNFGKKLNHYVSSFIRLNPQYVQEEESTDIEQFGTPRSWTQLSNEMQLYTADFISTNSQILAKMKVSNDAAMSFTKHVLYVDSIDFSGIVANRTMQNIADLSEPDKILWSYIANYVETPDDAAYIIDLMNHNHGADSIDNFIGFFSGELHTKYQLAQDGKPITPAVEILVSKLINNFDPVNFKLSEKQTALLTNLEFQGQPQMLALISEYIN